MIIQSGLNRFLPSIETLETAQVYIKKYLLGTVRLASYLKNQSFFQSYNQRSMSNFIKSIARKAAPITRRQFQPPECWNSTLAPSLRAHCKSDTKDWPRLLASVILALRVTPCTLSTRTTHTVRIVQKECRPSSDAACYCLPLRATDCTAKKKNTLFPRLLYFWEDNSIYKYRLEKTIYLFKYPPAGQLTLIWKVTVGLNPVRTVLKQSK